MPIPPLVIAVGAAAAAVAAARLALRETRRITARLDARERRRDALDRAERPMLRRDPETGDWRPG